MIFHRLGHTETCCLFQAGMWELMLRISISQGRPAEREKKLNISINIKGMTVCDTDELQLRRH